MRKINLHFLFLLLAILIYLITHFVNVEDFPIYFFADEAIQAVKAEQLLNNGFKDELGNFLPVLFKRFDHYNLGITVYFNIPGLLLFGKKIWVVRNTTVIISLIGSIFTALIAKNILKIKNYWVAVLYLSLIPWFFLHSRTGFEAPTAVSWYAGFLYFYLLYRLKNLKFIFPAIIMAVISYYSVPGMWFTVLASLALFVLVDIFYHWQHKFISLLGVILLILLFMPFLNLRLKNPKIFENELKVYDTYLIKNIPVGKKIIQATKFYLTAINPIYLFFYSDTYLANYGLRHTLKGYGHFPSWSLPIVTVGFFYLFVNKNKPIKRILLVSLLTAPLGAIISGFSGTRNMQMVITTTLLFCLGIKVIENIWEKNIKRFPSNNFLTILLFATLTIFSIATTYDSIKNGPTWHQNYGLYGLQYGTKQLFEEIDRSLDLYQYVVASPDYANATNVYIPFFLVKEKRERVKLRSIKDFVNEKLPTENTVIFAPQEDYDILMASNLFQNINTRGIIYAPNGAPAFYKFELEYK